MKCQAVRNRAIEHSQGGMNRKKKSGWGEMQKGKPEVISEMDSGLSVQRSRKTTAASYTATSNRKKISKKSKHCQEKYDKPEKTLSLVKTTLPRLKPEVVSTADH